MPLCDHEVVLAEEMLGSISEQMCGTRVLLMGMAAAGYTSWPTALRSEDCGKMDTDTTSPSRSRNR